MIKIVQFKSQERLQIECNLSRLGFKASPMETIHNHPLRLNFELIILQVGLDIPQISKLKSHCHEKKARIHQDPSTCQQTQKWRPHSCSLLHSIIGQHKEDLIHMTKASFQGLLQSTSQFYPWEIPRKKKFKLEFNLYNKLKTILEQR